MANLVQHYALGGLNIQSEIALPALQTQNRSHDVTICTGIVAKTLEDIADSGQLFDQSPLWEVSSRCFLLYIPKVARILAIEGKEIVIDPLSGDDPQGMQTLLLNTVFPVLCLQRGLLPLHMSAVAVDGGCIGFTGQSGAGKSTLAAYLEKQGYSVLSDDLCVVSFDQQGMPIVHPWIPYFRLWKKSLDAMEIDSHDRLRAWRKKGKYYIPTDRNFSTQPQKLLNIFHLRENRLSSETTIEQVQGMKSMMLLNQHTVMAITLSGMKQQKEQFENCSRLCRFTKLFHLSRHKKFQYLPDTVQTIQSFLHI
ncbi:hypothetical protein ACQZV8_02335 [Magnetococcales bacterium HHB-1]